MAGCPDIYSNFRSQVQFTVNGRLHKIGPEIPVDTSINTYLRYYAFLKGAKTMCQEGGCGCCVVALRGRNVFTKEVSTYAVNSCLIPIFSCHGRDIITIEGIGSRKRGYHVAQSRLAEYGGSQCGFCSPGMIMNMYSLMQKGDVKIQEVEDSFDGNICRCTGYRPILDAFKSICVDVHGKLMDVEDLHEMNNCQNCPEKLNTREGEEQDYDYVLIHKDIEGTIYSLDTSPLHLLLKGSQWFKVTSVEDILKIFKQIDVPYMLVAGNTAHGVYQMKVIPKIFIDIQDVYELKSYSFGKTLKVGASVTLNDVIKLFHTLAKREKSFSYLESLANHISLIANVPVRNVGTLAGNLSIKHEHNEFPSDIFLTTTTVGATIDIVSEEQTMKKVDLPSFLDLNMKHKVILCITYPPLTEEYKLRTYKIIPRAQNAHAYVNAGFLFKLDLEEKGKILERPRIVYGGINPQFIHASQTEQYLEDKNLFNPEVLKTALSTLQLELVPDHVLPDASPVFRKKLALALFYKTVLSLSPPGLSERFYSGGTTLFRPISSGKQDFATNRSEWPVNQPVLKLEAYAQCSGATEYTNDIPTVPGEASAAFVLTSVGQGNISSIDPSEAMKMPGVLKFISAKDVPGINSIVPLGRPNIVEEEELFCSSKIKYAGQPMGLVVAESESIALNAALRVKVNYSDVQKPAVNMRKVIDSGDRSRIREEQSAQYSFKESEINLTDKTYEIKGSFDMGSQFHFPLENHVTLCIPKENGMDVFAASQWIDGVQIAISRATKIPENRINVTVKQVGGAFGGKITRNLFVATACGVAAHILNRPVRFVLDLQTCMKAIGKRWDFSMNYQVKTNSEGKILRLKVDIYENVGCSYNEDDIQHTVNLFKNCYNNENWEVKAYSVRLDVPSTTFCRSPGSVEGIGGIEYIMEHIAHTVKKDPIEVRVINMTKHNPLPGYIEDLKKHAEFDDRKKAIDAFNKSERWKKKGIAIGVMNYPLEFTGGHYVLLSVYAVDGTVTLTHGGIEIGQGIRTKAAQVAAYMLKIPLEFVSVKDSHSITAPNDAGTLTSITSDCVAIGVVRCCQELLKRMIPARKELKDPSWLDWVKAANKQNTDLTVVHMYPENEKYFTYNIYGVTVAETEIDLLTGQYQILRVDILEDIGNSLSPHIDIGQVEGAFVMGLGYWLKEYLVYDPKTGELLTDRTWNYKPLLAKDIPIDFRVYFLKNAPNPVGVLRSKATGEPPLTMSCSVFFALKNALAEARREAGKSDEWFPMNAPATVENVFLMSLTNPNLFTFQ